MYFFFKSSHYCYINRLISRQNSIHMIFLSTVKRRVITYVLFHKKKHFSKTCPLIDVILECLYCSPRSISCIINTKITIVYHEMRRIRYLTGNFAAYKARIQFLAFKWRLIDFSANRKCFVGPLRTLRIARSSLKAIKRADDRLQESKECKFTVYLN